MRRGKTLTGLKNKILARLTPESRTLMIDFLALRCPTSVKRITERLIDVPVPSALRSPADIPLFIHIPKNAGVTITHQLYGRFIGHRTAEWYKIADPRFFEAKHKFAIVRDPFDRFVSAFSFLDSGGSSEVSVSLKARSKLRAFSNIMEFAEYFDSAGLHKLEQLDPVFHSQYRYLFARDKKLLVDQVFRLEDVSGHALNVHGYKIDMSKVQNQGSQSKSGLLKLCDQTALKSLVKRLYACDYQLFDTLPP